MQSVSIKGMDDLDKDLKAILKDAPDMRRRLHEDIARNLKTEVDAQIGSSGINDSHGTVKGWQEERVGSGGGYAAISAVSGQTGANSPGAITNYLESGHKTRQPTGSAKRRRRSQAKKAYVDGFHFYQSAGVRAENIAIASAEKFADELKQKLEG